VPRFQVIGGLAPSVNSLTSISCTSWRRFCASISLDCASNKFSTSGLQQPA